MEVNAQQQLLKLLPLFHRSPVAMARVDAQGFIHQLNPKAVQLMMPMVAHLGLSGDNLLDTLTGFLPSVGRAVTNFKPEFGMIIEQEPYRIRLLIDSTLIERQFSLTVEKISSDSLLIFFEDVTDLLTKVNLLHQRS